LFYNVLKDTNRSVTFFCPLKQDWMSNRGDDVTLTQSICVLAEQVYWHVFREHSPWCSEDIGPSHPILGQEVRVSRYEFDIPDTYQHRACRGRHGSPHPAGDQHTKGRSRKGEEGRMDTGRAGCFSGVQSFITRHRCKTDSSFQGEGKTARHAQERDES
jgi:hypothetical protein